MAGNSETVLIFLVAIAALPFSTGNFFGYNNGCSNIFCPPPPVPPPKIIVVYPPPRPPPVIYIPRPGPIIPVPARPRCCTISGLRVCSVRCARLWSRTGFTLG